MSLISYFKTLSYILIRYIISYLCYDQEGPGFESQQGKEILSSLKPLRPVLGHTHPYIQRVTDLFL